MGFFSFSSPSSATPNWLRLEAIDQLNKLIKKSAEKPVLFFKHSRSCSISSMAKHRLESQWNLINEDIIPVYLDLLSYRSISNEIAEKLNVIHQSPQVIVVKDGKMIYEASHGEISMEAIMREL